VNPAFNGIKEKLERAKENILNLQAEIHRFFQDGEYPTLPQDNKEMLLKAIAYHKERIIPLRFSVLSGEIIHHLRSCFDHVVWQFSTPAYRKERFWEIEFPILEARPVDKKSVGRYNGKIEGITKSAVRGLIERLQPYNAPDPTDSPLLIIHKMDVFDKHRELIICASTGAFEFPSGVIERFASYQRGEPGSKPVDLKAEFEAHGKVVPQISFKNFGRRDIHPVVPALIELFNYTDEVMGYSSRL
jgi:hypothetical protein